MGGNQSSPPPPSPLPCIPAEVGREQSLRCTALFASGCSIVSYDQSGQALPQAGRTKQKVASPRVIGHE